MGLFEVIIVVGVIASFLFFMGVLYWALRTRRNRDVPTPTPVHIDRSYREASPAYPTQDYPPEPVQTQSSYDDRSEDFETGRESDSPGDEEVIWGKMPKEETSSVIIPAGKLPGMAAASEDGDLENQEFYGIEGYDYSADYSEEETLEDDEGEGLQPKIVTADGKVPVVEKRDRPQKRILPESVRCNICLGFIKTGLPLITCICGKNYHISCASRIEECPICHRDMLDYDDLVLEASKRVVPEWEDESDGTHVKDRGEVEGDGKGKNDGGAGRKDHGFEVKAGSIPGPLAGEADDDSGADPDDEHPSQDSGTSLGLLDDEQMDRLKKLLKKYNLEKSQDPLSSLALLKSDWDDR